MVEKKGMLAKRGAALGLSKGIGEFIPPEDDRSMLVRMWVCVCVECVRTGGVECMWAGSLVGG